MNVAAAVLADQRMSYTPPYDVGAFRKDFPILATPLHCRAFLYSAAGAQRPFQVIDSISRCH